MNDASILPSNLPDADLVNILRSATRGLRIVLGHDWLTGMRGGERVLSHFCEAFPSSPLVTLLANPTSVSPVIRNRPIITSFLQKIPHIDRHYRKLLPLMGLAATHTPIPEGDLFLTTSSCVAHAFNPPPSMKMLCYCFTPMRYAWLFPKEYLGPAKATLAAPYLAYLRHWDKSHSSRVDRYVALSQHVQNRIQSFYNRKSDIVYPPVDTIRCTPAPDGGSSNNGYDLIVSALVPYKKIDLAINAYNKLGFPLKIVGAGGQAARLAQMAGPNIDLLGWRSDEDILHLYRNCRFLIFPGEEDYGIVPLEAMACGKPVIALNRGGATETIANGISGLFFNDQTTDSLLDAVSRASASSWSPPDIRARAEMFGPRQFLTGMASSILACLNSPRL